MTGSESLSGAMLSMLVIEAHPNSNGNGMTRHLEKGLGENAVILKARDVESIPEILSDHKEISLIVLKPEIKGAEVLKDIDFKDGTEVILFSPNDGCKYPIYPKKGLQVNICMSEDDLIRHCRRYTLS